MSSTENPLANISIEVLSKSNLRLFSIDSNYSLLTKPIAFLSNWIKDLWNDINPRKPRYSSFNFKAVNVSCNTI